MGNFIYNNPRDKEKRRILRANLTDAEKVLWRFLRNKQLGHYFHRQYSVGRYVLDFYCPKVRLAIEVDGGGHAEKTQWEYDRARDRYLTGNNIHVLRFWNNDVLKNTPSVIESVINEIKRNRNPS